MSEIQLAFIGTGSMGQAAHLRNYVSLPGCRVVALAEKRPLLAAQVANRFGVERVYDGYEDLLAKEDVDGIVAIQPFELHARYVPDLLQKGVPLLTEKPLAGTYADGETVLRAAKAATAPLYLAYHKRSDPAVTYAKKVMAEWSESGAAGALKYVRVTMPPGDWSAEAFATNVWTNETFDAGLPPCGWDEYAGFVNYYIHQVNLLRFLFGEDYSVEYADPVGVTMTVRSKSGVIGVLEMCPYSTSVGWDESVLLGFDRGWIRIDLPAPMVINLPGRVTVSVEGPEGAVTSTPSLKPWHAMRCQAANFLAAIRGEAHPLCGAEDGLKDLASAQDYISKRKEAQAK